MSDKQNDDLPKLPSAEDLDTVLDGLEAAYPGVHFILAAVTAEDRGPHERGRVVRFRDSFITTIPVPEVVAAYLRECWLKMKAGRHTVWETGEHGTGKKVPL